VDTVADGTLGRPRCSNCGQDLTALTESSKCPECGRPIVEVLVRDGSALTKLMGRRYTSKAQLFGIPAICIAYGIGPDGKPGHAKGWIAMGDKATGVIAFGGMAVGIVAFGGFAFGVLSAGGFSIGILSAMGGMAVSPLGLAMGGCAIGALATGGVAIGIGASGGMTVAVFGLGPPPSNFSYHRLSPRGEGSPQAKAFFELFDWLLGSPRTTFGTLRVLAWQVVATSIACLLLALPAFLRWQRSSDDDAPTPYSAS
jgi:predicted RNA-binding Zn-ribbon protein involved in translation (DUF1610 family)